MMYVFPSYCLRGNAFAYCYFYYYEYRTRYAVREGDMLYIHVLRTELLIDAVRKMTLVSIVFLPIYMYMYMY